MPGPVRLVAPAPPAPLPELDEHQAEVVRRAVAGESLAVLGAPGTGKTTTALAVLLEAVAAGVPADRVVMLSPRRKSAGALRERAAGLLGQVTRGPLVRTPTSLAFTVLRTEAVREGRPLPVLISGPEQDVLLRELLEGHLEGEGVGLRLPDGVPVEVLAQRAFRDELRDLLMRAAERGVGPDELAALGERHGRAEWTFAATLYREYLDVVALGTATPDAGERLDPGLLVERAAEAIAAWPDEDVPSWDLVVVDDAQESTQAVGQLARVLADRGARLVVLGDPDVAVQTHRGAVPTAFLDGFGLLGTEPLVLRRGHRQGPRLAEVTSRVTALVRGAGTHGHQDVEPRGAQDPGDVEPVTVAVLSSRAQEAAFVARALREAHLLGHVPWRDMAVVARSGSQVTALRSALVRLSVPVHVPGAELPVRSEPAVRPFLLAMRAVIDAEDPSRDADEPWLDEETVAELLTSVVGGLDALGLRRLRKLLREAELSSGGYRASGALLVEAVTASGLAATLPAHAAPQARALRTVTAVLEAGRRAMREPGATAATVLWAVWSAAGLEGPWRAAALAGGVTGLRADRDLDAMLALFKAAERHAERMPHAGPEGFLEHLAAQDLTEDTLAARATGADAVTLCTAASAAGGQWELVAVTGVQDGAWPDLRLRDSLLGAQGLVDAVAGRLAARGTDLREARRAVLDDELRSFALAVSRARTRLVVTAVQDEEDRPSGFLDLVAPPADDGDVESRRRDPELPLDLRGLVAQLRREALAPELEDAPSTEARSRADRAARHLARLAAAGVPGADPATWAGLAPVSTEAPLYGPQQRATLSPSRVESLSRCSLRWALESAGGTGTSSFASELGTLVHEIADAHPSGTREELHAELDRLWPTLDLPEGWLTEREHERARRMVDRLADYLAAHPEVVGTEVDVDLEMATPAGPVRIRGRVDRVERDWQGRLRIVDLKTSKYPVSAAEAREHAQLGVYQLAVEHGALRLAPDTDTAPDTGPDTQTHPGTTPPGAPARSGGGALVYLGTGARGATERQQAPLVESEDPAWAERLVGQARAEMTGPSITVAVNALCQTCPVRRSCPLGDEGAQVTA